MNSEVRNYFKLDILIARSYRLLRDLFKSRYALFNHGQRWEDSPRCGKSYLNNILSRNKTMSLTAVQRIAVADGNSNEWDLSTLTILLLNDTRPSHLNQAEIQRLDKEDRLLKQLRDIRNKLAHHAAKSIPDNEFNQLWTDLTTILVSLGDTESELDKLKDDLLFEPASQQINEANTKEALHLNSLGTKAHKEGNFTEAITLFTKATVLSGVTDQDRAVFYSNMSSSRLALYETRPPSRNRVNIDDLADQQYRALLDAKKARNLWPTWWKGHFRVGKVYVTMNEVEKAIHSFERALALAPTNNDVLQALYSAREIHGRQSRQEHLDPRLQPKTMEEHLNELKKTVGFDPQQVRNAHALLSKVYPSGADVVRAHKYEHGDIDVKQDYEQAARYFAKAASQGNAEGMYNLARLTDRGLGVKKDHAAALKLLQQAVAQPLEHPLFKGMPNVGVAEAEHSLGLRYAEGVGVHKDLPTAAYWYQRATDHGNANAANNLALMYRDGQGIDRDLKKAQELFELSAKRGDPNAMLTLAKLLLDKNAFQMAKIWYDRACGSGNLVAQSNRSALEAALTQKENFIKSCSPDVLQKINQIRNVIESLKAPETVYRISKRERVYDYDVLVDLARQGSITARRLCNALEHFAQALLILTENVALTEHQEITFVLELAKCYEIEHIVAQFPTLGIRQKAEQVIDHVLQRSQVDEQARICFSVLHMDSFELVDQFLHQAKQKYPKSIFFYELSAAVNGWMKNYESVLYDANTGLEIDPNYCELLYFKAVALRLLGRDNDEAITAYRKFLSQAPRDHRKVPESYYAMASCHLLPNMKASRIETIRQIFKEGEQAEKEQLPCFLPYESNSKTLLVPLLEAQTMLDVPITLENDRKARLSNPYRIEIIKRHREWEAKTSDWRNLTNVGLFSTTQEPRVKQHIAKSLVGLKPISLRELDPNRDHVYDGYVLSVTIIEEAYSWTPSIHLIVEDEHLDCERMFIYGFPEEQGEFLTSRMFSLGSKMSIINPYLRLGANDMKPLIRIDDFASIIMHSESERVPHMCRCCGEPNASHVCSRCRRARYCSKECQTMDWKVFQHKLICQKQ